MVYGSIEKYENIGKCENVGKCENIGYVETLGLLEYWVYETIVHGNMRSMRTLEESPNLKIKKAPAGQKNVHLYVPTSVRSSIKKKLGIFSPRCQNTSLPPIVKNLSFQLFPGTGVYYTLYLKSFSFQPSNRMDSFGH